ncbi:MAG: hypothetical protein IPK87_08660 [Planctomycetes bacterium]|nr:hypothetical protein [Planctomycetota bacterium]
MNARNLLMLLLPVFGIIAACASSKNYDPEFNAAPQDVQSDWPLARERCSQCHSLDRVFEYVDASTSRDEIEMIVEDMAGRKKSEIQDDEIPRIVEVLDWRRQK